MAIGNNILNPSLGKKEFIRQRFNDQGMTVGHFHAVIQIAVYQAFIAFYIEQVAAAFTILLFLQGK